MKSPDLILDPAIRNWCVLPILTFVLCISLARTYVAHLSRSDKQPDKEELSRRQTLARVERLRSNGQYVNPKAFAARKHFFLNKEAGVLNEEVPGAANPMANPMGMMEMVKNQAYFGITQMGMMQFSETFFSGFVLVKLPFSLTNSFKAMLQRGIELSTLDASYVSATSWMFLVSFGIRDLQRIFLKDEALIAEEQQGMQAQMGMAGANQMGFDCSKAYAAARDTLRMTRHAWALEDAERRLLGDSYPQHRPATEEMLASQANKPAHQSIR